ncbi:MAG: recombination mediator RecR [Clostridiales bacterium]|jgi:recombination protein RecR|nr:recombination mediator RecR [Clostridiales bacterium]
MQYIPIFSKLVEEFEKLPGVGSKSAQKMAYYIIAADKSVAKTFADTLLEAKQKIRCCSVCQNLTDKELCSICSGDKRDRSVICVVEKPSDVDAIERTRDFNGLYHVLHGLISPMNDVGPDDIKLSELLVRVSENDINEVIMATSPNVEGQATAMYIAKLLKPFDVKVTGLALGIPVGGSLEYSDSITLARAMENRREI